MARTVDYIPFSTNTGANIQGQSSYVIEPIRLTGHQAGVAKSAVVNKTLRQSSVMVAALANMLSEALDVDVLDDGDVDALMGLLQDVVLGGRSTILTTDVVYYIRTGGSNSNDGLTPSTAFATPQKAFDTILYELNLNGYMATIDIGNGTFSSLAMIGDVFAGNLEVRGAGKGSTTIDGVNSPAIYLDVGARALISDMKLQSSGTGFNNGHNITIYNNSVMDLNEIHFGHTEGSGSPPNGAHINCGIGSTVYMGQWDRSSVYTIGNSAYAFIITTQGSVIGIANAAVTLTGTPAWSGYGIACVNNSSINFNNYAGQQVCSFTGAATGPRFLVDGTSTIGTGTGDANWLPGSTAGSWVNSNLQLNYR